ncbi:MAG: hypothetical protein KatS3mg003_0145 [Candidatus Nitrosocaldaceae archaeon]|nr:MAG: hypothetical protein KatS3mg003_0145 [Candidatus Nitrosocaldaceae archaeon]
MKPIDIDVKNDDDEIEGYVKINYNGRYDGIQVNTYVLGGKELVEFIALNDKEISMPTRLYVPKNEIVNNQFSFRAVANNTRGKRIRFRAAIIQEHKEIESDTKFLER